MGDLLGGLKPTDSFLQAYRKMDKKACLKESLLNKEVDRLQRCPIQSSNTFYKYVYHHHQ